MDKFTPSGIHARGLHGTLNECVVSKHVERASPCTRSQRETGVVATDRVAVCLDRGYDSHRVSGPPAPRRFKSVCSRCQFGRLGKGRQPFGRHAISDLIVSGATISGHVVSGSRFFRGLKHASTSDECTDALAGLWDSAIALYSEAPNEEALDPID